MTLLFSFEKLVFTIERKLRERNAEVTEHLVKRIADLFIRRFQIEEEDRDLICLGIEVILNTAITAVVVLVTGILLHNGFGALLFLLCFANIRSYSGGYHASTKWRCFVVSVLCYLLSYGMMKGLLHLGEMVQSIVVTVGIVGTFFIFAKCAPVDHPNKRIREETKQRNRIIAFLLLIGWLFASGVTMLIGKFEAASQIWATIMIVAGLLWVARRTTCKE